MALLNDPIHLRKGDSDAGQATIEFALLLPLFAFCLTVLCSAVGIGLTSIRLTDTARLAARSASTSDNPTDVVESIVGPSGIHHFESIDTTQHFLTVQLTKNIQIPLLGISIPKVTVSAQSTVLIEGMPALRND